MNIEQRLAKWARVEMTYDARGLPERDKRFLQKLIEASRYMDEAFWRQSWSGAVEVRDRLRALESERSLLRLVNIMAGPYDRLEEFEPFLDLPPKPLGAGFYPDDLTKEEFERCLACHPEQRESLLSPYTVVKREGDNLIAVPYHEEYREFVEPASRLLKEAAELTDNRSLERYLTSRAEALLIDDYYQSDIDWI
ncbi:MAG: peptidase, partial [Anaerolineae bacterium]|nr:peptidase [Anaerolineae bacterium]